MKKVRWGLLSTAHINRRLIPAIRASKRGELVAVASRDLDKAKAYATQWDIPKAFGSYQEMLDSGQVDAVYISLPNHLHAEWTIKALESGVHVLNEKPFALSLQEVDAMIAASQKSGQVLAEAFMYRHHPQTKMVGEWVRSGKLGKIVLVRGVFNYRQGSLTDVRMIPEYGGGALWDVGVYPISFAQYVYGGSPISVSGMQVIGETGVDEVFLGQMTYASGRAEGQAQLACSFRSAFQTQIEVYGEEGTLTLNRPFIGVENNHLIFTPDEGEAQEIEYPRTDLYLGEVEDLQAAILDGKPTYISLKESRDHVHTVLGLYEAARSGMEVRLDHPRWK